MAVYQGARRRRTFLDGLALPGGGATRSPRPRGSRPDASDDAAASTALPSITLPFPRLRPKLGSGALAPRIARRRVGSILAAIVVLFGLGFVSLSQSVRVAATSYDIVRLQAERDRLEAVRLDLRSDLDRLASEPAVRKLALDHGLGQLDAPLVVQAR